jgi:hypothetical protein
MARVVFFTANPTNGSFLKISRELREVQKRIDESGAISLELILRPAAEPQDLGRHLQRDDADIIHFSGHSNRDGLWFEDGQAAGKEIPTKVLDEMFAQRKGTTRCVVLNSCWSQRQAKVLAKHVECVIGMASKVEDNAAITFSAGFYEALAFGRDVDSAFKHGCQQMAIQDPRAKKQGRMVCGAKVRAGEIRFSTRPELRAEFVLDGNKTPRKDKHGNFQIRLYIVGAPNNAVAVVYQLDKSFPRDERFTEITSADSSDLSDVIYQDADCEIRAVVWQQDNGYGTRTRLIDALRRRYGTNPTPEIGGAMDEFGKGS